MASLFASASAKDGIKKAMLKKIAKHMGIEKDPSIQSLENQVQKNVAILILDEVDMFIKKRDSDGERFFCELVKLANEANGFNLIGISNSVNDVYASRIRQTGSVRMLSGLAWIGMDMILTYMSICFVSLQSLKRLCFLHTTRMV
jgi:cell division control protein 6